MSATADLYTPELDDRETALVRAMRRVSQIIGTQLLSTLDEVSLIQNGVKPSLIDNLKQMGLSQSESSWIIKPRTLAHRKSRKELLTQEETERFLRAIKIFVLANEVFGDKDKSRQWLNKPRSRFGGHSAMVILQNEPGAQLVEEALNQIDSGYFA